MKGKMLYSKCAWLHKRKVLVLSSSLWLKDSNTADSCQFKALVCNWKIFTQRKLVLWFGLWKTHPTTHTQQKYNKGTYKATLGLWLKDLHTQQTAVCSKLGTVTKRFTNTAAMYLIDKGRHQATNGENWSLTSINHALHSVNQLIRVHCTIGH